MCQTAYVVTVQKKKQVSEGQYSQNKKKHEQGCSLQRNRRKGERLTVRDKEKKKAHTVEWSRRHKRHHEGKREGHS